MIDDAALIARLDRLPDKIRAVLADEIDRLASALRRRAGGPAGAARLLRAAQPKTAGKIRGGLETAIRRELLR